MVAVWEARRPFGPVRTFGSRVSRSQRRIDHGELCLLALEQRPRRLPKARIRSGQAVDAADVCSGTRSQFLERSGKDLSGLRALVLALEPRERRDRVGDRVELADGRGNLLIEVLVPDQGGSARSAIGSGPLPRRARRPPARAPAQAAGA